MALPIVAGVMTVAGWFMKGGAIASIFSSIGVKLASKAVIVPILIATVVLLFAARIAFLIAVVDFAFLTINFLHYFFDALPTLLSSDTFLSLGYDVMRSIGLIEALKDAFAIFDVLLVSLLTAWALKFAYHTSKLTSDEFFKIGMIVQA